MDLAARYLQKGALYPEFIEESPAPGTGIIIVIPAFNEPEIAVCLSSLARCNPPPVPAEVIIVVNSPASSGLSGIEANAITLMAIHEWRRVAGQTFFRLYVIDAGQPALTGWGVGTARKTGMDEAVRRFCKLGYPDGVIVSLDADCKVADNYFTALWHDFALDRNAGACSISFRHREENGEEANPAINAMRQYELHLRYFVRALRFIGYPYPFHTIGSAVAVKVYRYVGAGGMSRNQGGEDFYFIGKLVVSDDFINLNSTTVFPSARLSARVPFGTGPAISTMIKSGAGDYLTYAPESFIPLRAFFGKFSTGCSPAGAGDDYGLVPDDIRSFVDVNEWNHRKQELKDNTSSPAMYSKRFFAWFNAFRIVKYLNHVHGTLYVKMPVAMAASRLLTMSGIETASRDVNGLLESYRILDSF
ncbi:MAG: hypothetical protein RBS37_05660 [Bacteroidales bacterium]|jgi:glycosyltransferase involved in cell wall biosynthesis|nr:hypothetical protein [Bacteroidales bacterium]